MNRCFRASGQFDHARRNFLQPAFRRLERHQVRFGKIAVVMRLFLACASFSVIPRHVVPSPRFLRKFSAALQHFDLPRNLVLQRAPDAAETVHVLDLDLRAQFLLALRTHADVHVATHHPLFHVAIADAAVDQNVLERVEIFVGHVRAA